MEPITLHWSQHDSHQTGAISYFFQRKDFSDCILIAEGRPIYTHKLVLAAASNFFYELFNARPALVYEITDISYGGLCNLVEFMYTGMVQVMRIEMQEFFQSCNLLQMRGINELNISSAVPPQGVSPPAPPTPQQQQQQQTPITRKWKKKCGNCYKFFNSIKHREEHEAVCTGKRRSRARRRLRFDRRDAMDVN